MTTTTDDTNRAHLIVDATRRPEDLSWFLFFTGLFGNSSDGGALPSSTASEFDNFGTSCVLGMGPVDELGDKDAKRRMNQNAGGDPHIDPSRSPWD